ncbi:MAG TPA: RHS repeat-associated core domain-containing protein [Thermoanaerobaculia bacterium]|jgi:RHS repeat-associated protein|nr:RHS repeat-associated core domain-containing protein [Thermoanaerobaculia bacterium]
MSAMSCRVSLALVLLTALAAPGLADVHPNTAGGFPVDQSFHVGDIDNVNLFNGALTVTIPIGPSYPVNGGFSYSLKLVANSSPWIFQTVHYLIGNEDQARLQANPNPCSNAGLGWRVSLGRLNPPCQVPDANDTLLGPIYQDEMGTDHVFYPTLHWGDPEDAAVSGITDIEYTRDGTYLRLKVYASGIQEVEFPDGMVRKFDSTGMPTEIRDAFGNWLHIAYLTQPYRWLLTDSQNRTHTLYFRNDLPQYAQVLDRVVLSAFGSTAAKPVTATYQLTYGSQQIGRSCPNSDTDLPGSQGDRVNVPFLTGVTLPDLSTFQMPLSSYVTALPAAGQKCTSFAGNPLGITLPTLGRMEWTWQTFMFPISSATKAHFQTNPGVATRTMRNAAGGVLGTWSYVQQLGSTQREVTTTVTDPLGNRVVNHFSTAVDLLYSLPFTPDATLNVAVGVDLNLSRQTFPAGSSVPLRSEYVLYERDPVGGVAGVPNIYNTNRRPVRSRTVYEDDGTYTGAVSSQFDGVGHYRSQDTEGNFPGSNVRHHFANSNPARGTYVVNPTANTGSGFTPVPSSSPWVLETMTYASDTENGATAWTDLCYAPGTSTVIRKREHRLDGASQSANDLLAVYGLDATGNVASERYFGGDSPGYGIATGVSDLCSMGLPATPQYQLNHTYSSGVRATSQYAGASFLSLNQTIDAATGLVSSSRDAAGVLTSYLYDTLGRRTWGKPAQSGWTQYVYTAATPSIKPNVAVRQRDNGSETATVLAVSQVVFDDFGRVYQELRQMPDGSTGKRQTAYDGAGNKSTVSEVMTGTPSNVTTFSGYDPFGRPGTITPPDGAAHNVTMTYHGVRQVDRTVKIGTVLGSLSPSTTTEVYDRQGRLLSVTEPSGNGGSQVTTTYGYDVGNRLSSVSTLGQSRSFAYDRAGFLQSETHPEKGAGGNGTVFYSAYDSRGHALHKTDGPNNLAFVYDSFERLTQVNEFGGLGRPLKSFTYAPSNGTNDLRLGKLWQASRFNYFTLSGSSFTVRVDETYVYGGRDGRVSRRDTAASTGESFTQSFSYNALGLTDTLGYPACTQVTCTQTPVPARTVQNTYSQGLLTGVSAGVTNYGTISYYPNLLVSQVVHGNGVVDTQGNDPFSMRRPSSEGASGPSAAWSSGAYSYDGAGNITRIGTSSYTYDAVSRLTSGTIFDGPTGGGTQKTQSYTFDSFGNLTNIAGTSGRVTPTSSATNRLNGAGTAYDAAGNLINWNGAVYIYDHFNQMTDMTSGSEHALYIYTVDDERVWSYDLTRNISHWTLRDLGGKVLRDYVNNGVWSLGTDYIYRDGLLLASETQTSQFHYHLDHLGTPRLITTVFGTQAAYHAYYPFGEEATAFNQDTERMKFTGHERDLASPNGAGDDLDYMHARHESPVTGRFLSVDSAVAKPSNTQTWNRYGYALNNPLKNVDKDGHNAVLVVGGVIVALAVTVAVMHAVEMKTNASYQQRVIDGAKRSAELVTAAASSVLSKTTKSDKNERDYDITGPLPTKENKGGGRGRFQTVEDALDQADSIASRQAKIWKGQADGIIDSVEKSLDRLINSLKDIRTPADAEPKDEKKDDGSKKQSSR